MTSRQRLSPDDRRAQVVQVALATFAELGASGATTKAIAARAGITEAYLLRIFPTKTDLYRAAVEAPLDELISQLRAETRSLAAQPDVARSAVLLRAHELLLSTMVELAPVLASAAFALPASGGDFYPDVLMPRLADAIREVIPAVTGHTLPSDDADIFVAATIGMHVTIALDHLLTGARPDVPRLAREITAMFAPGVPDIEAPDQDG